MNLPVLLVFLFFISAKGEKTYRNSSSFRQITGIGRNYDEFKHYDETDEVIHLHQHYHVLVGNLDEVRAMHEDYPARPAGHPSVKPPAQQPARPPVSNDEDEDCKNAGDNCLIGETCCNEMKCLRRGTGKDRYLECGPICYTRDCSMTGNRKCCAGECQNINGKKRCSKDCYKTYGPCIPTKGGLQCCWGYECKKDKKGAWRCL